MWIASRAVRGSLEGAPRTRARKRVAPCGPGGLRTDADRSSYKASKVQCGDTAARTASGEPITLEIEGAGASLLRTVGVSASAIEPGDRVTAVVSPRAAAERVGYLAAPVSGSAKMRYRPDLEPTDTGCDLDSAERFLRDAR
jgi:hypothetical protein